jgi:hypothetical protein
VGGVSVGWAVLQGWHGWRVRFPASEVRSDFFFFLLFLFRFLSVLFLSFPFFDFILFYFVFPSFLSFLLVSFGFVSSLLLFFFPSVLLMPHISIFPVRIFSYFQNASHMNSVGSFRTMFQRTADLGGYKLSISYRNSI